MAVTYEPIATVTLGSNQQTVTFTNIPGTYTDLRLVAVLTESPNLYTFLRFNSDSGSNYSRTYLRGNGSAASSARTSNATEGYLDAHGSTPAINVWDIMSYANTNVNKTALNSVANVGAGEVNRYVYLWRSTSAITSITISSPNNTSSILSGSTFSLYGIKAA